MDTLLKHNKETEDKIDERWHNWKEDPEFWKKDIIDFITSQNTELLKKIAKGEIESIKKDIKHWEEYSAGTYQQGGIEQAKLSLTRWQQVLEDLEK